MSMPYLNRVAYLIWYFPSLLLTLLGLVVTLPFFAIFCRFAPDQAEEFLEVLNTWMGAKEEAMEKDYKRLSK